MTALHGRICLVTGVTSGIGKATAARLAELGGTVVGVARRRDRGEAALAEIERRRPPGRLDLLTADLADLASVRALGDEIQARYDHLHVLVNNAAVAKFSRDLTNDGVETTFATNHVGPFLLTNLLCGMLRQSAPARVITVSSQRHRQVKRIDWDQLRQRPRFQPTEAYDTSKLLNVLFTYELARRLRATRVTANCADPGFVRTALGREATGSFRLFLGLTRPMQTSPRAGAATVVHLASSPELTDVNGAYFRRRRRIRSSELSYDRAVAERLWAFSAQLCGLDSHRR